MHNQTDSTTASFLTVLAQEDVILDEIREFAHEVEQKVSQLQLNTTKESQLLKLMETTHG